MADSNNSNSWLARTKDVAKKLVGIVEIGEQVSQYDYSYGVDAVGVDILLGSGKRSSRSRVQIYQKWNYMMGDAICATGLRLHVTMALGGHETTGDTVFVERKADIKDGSQLAKIVEDIQNVVAPLLNQHAHTLCFKACGFGDAYARAYTREKVGLLDIDTGDAYYPPLVQPYERANDTVCFVVSDGKKGTVKLSIKQLVRMKMPRMEYVPQTRALDRAMRQRIQEDDLDQLPAMAGTAGGSFLFAAEEAFDNLTSSIVGLVGQRIMASIDETLVGVNLEGMTQEQRKDFMASMTKMLKTMKDRAEKHIKEGHYSAQRNIHLMPTSSDKQLTQVSSFQGASGAGSLTIDDVMFHARLLAGAFGIDLSMLGFADQLTGGLGEGGFNQTSAQAAERSGIIRTAFTEFAHSLVDLHTYAKYGWVFQDGDRPYDINFYGSIAALEAKEQTSRERSSNATAMLVQVLQQLRDIGMSEEAVEMILAKGMQLDTDYAKTLSKALKEAKPPADAQGGGFGSFGGNGGNGGNDDDSDFIPTGGGAAVTGEE